MWSIIVSVALWVIGLITGKRESVAEQLGRQKQLNEDHAADVAVIAKANEAAKKAAEEPADAWDKNDLDDPRNRGH